MLATGSMALLLSSFNFSATAPTERLGVVPAGRVNTNRGPWVRDEKSRELWEADDMQRRATSSYGHLEGGDEKSSGWGVPPRRIWKLALSNGKRLYDRYDYYIHRHSIWINGYALERQRVEWKGRPWRIDMFRDLYRVILISPEINTRTCVYWEIFHWIN